MPIPFGRDRRTAVDRGAQRVHDSAQKAFAYRDTRRAAGTVYDVACGNSFQIAEDDTADAVFPKVLHHAAHTGLEYDDLAVSGAAHARANGYAVADFQDLTVFVRYDFGRKLLYRLSDQRNYFAGQGCVF